MKAPMASMNSGLGFQASGLVSSSLWMSR
jgi:hypothetical protein